jgi:hypothetical protein
MKPGRPIAVLAVAAIIAMHGTCFSQGESAVPFLLIQPDPAANGWGGVSTAVATDDPIATIVNPAQLGLFSQNAYFAASTYTPKTLWLPRFGQKDLTYDVSAVSAGVNLAKAFGIGLPLSVGVGYSRVFLNLGTFFVTNSGSPEPIARYESWEKSECFSVGAAFDYYVRLGVGVNFETIASHLSPIGTEAEAGTGIANPTATDIGVLLEVPVIDIIGKANGDAVTLGPRLSPLANVSVGYAYQNIGRGVTYVDAAQGDPLPRNVILGMSAELGLVMDAGTHPWKLFSFTLAHEAEDLLAYRNADGSFGYQSGLGDISFFKHVVAGSLDDDERPALHKGWQLGFGELFYLRGGSFSESPNYGARNYTTSGYGLRLGGIFRLLTAIDAGLGADPVLSFLASHLDLGYDRAEYGEHAVLGGTTFDSITIVIR